MQDRTRFGLLGQQNIGRMWCMAYRTALLPFALSNVISLVVNF